MKPLNLLSAVTLLLLTLTTVLHAADSTSHEQQVETLFRLTQMEKKIQDSVDSVVQLQLRQNPQLGQHEVAVRDFFTKYIGWNALKNDIAEMYLSTFSEKELEQINAFYITPTGQRVIKVVPELVQQRNQLAMQRLQKNIGELQQIIAPPASTPARP
ncbi:MAG: hypothetical protein DRQ44_02255 [Gammaproteobacteria bacterium]|nr:MAG: hypothetical protein DRQ44_02255 [Gammaproteobacteria bacterium]